eukprot:6210756-Pleurochrysis_carterae.AAC.2
MQLHTGGWKRPLDRHMRYPAESGQHSWATLEQAILAPAEVLGLTTAAMGPLELHALAEAIAETSRVARIIMPCRRDTRGTAAKVLRESRVSLLPKMVTFSDKQLTGDLYLDYPCNNVRQKLTAQVLSFISRIQDAEPRTCSPHRLRMTGKLRAKTNQLKELVLC